MEQWAEIPQEIKQGDLQRVQALQLMSWSEEDQEDLRLCFQ